MENWNNPICMAESLFSNFDNLGDFDSEIFGEVRFYQRPMISHESLIDFDTTAEHHKLTKKETFRLRKNVADIYNLGARKYGKSLCTLKLDIPLSSIYDKRQWACFYSIDEKRLRGVMDDVKVAFDFHPIFKIWNYHCSFKPQIKFTNRSNGWRIQGVNMTLKGKNPGEQFYQIHADKFYGDEVSFETDTVFKKRKESESELGSIIRVAGMTDFSKHSPIGKIFRNIKNKKYILNLPQYVNPFWDENEKQDRIEAYGGKESLNYRVYVKGEIIEDATTEFDIERIQECYSKKKQIKRFELKKNQYKNFKNLIVVERPKNAERIFLVGDIGDGAGGSDISIFSEVGDKYNYLYNIVLYKMTEEEQYHVFDYLVEQTQANVLGFDCGEACGRGLYDRFEKRGFKDNLVWYQGNKKVITGFEKDKEGKILMVNGKPVPKEEFMSEWSIKRLKVLLYGTRVHIPIDYKFDNQISSVISTGSGTRKMYACISQTGDHLFDCFKIFAIAQWLKKDFNLTPSMAITIGLGISSGMRKAKEIIDLRKLKQKDFTDNIHEGKILDCSKKEFESYVKNLLIERANFYIFRGDVARAKIASSECQRLTQKFCNIKGD